MALNASVLRASDPAKQTTIEQALNAPFVDEYLTIEPLNAPFVRQFAALKMYESTGDIFLEATKLYLGS